MSVDQMARAAAACAAVLIVIGPLLITASAACIKKAREALSSVSFGTPSWKIPFSTKFVLSLFLCYIALTGPNAATFAPEARISVEEPSSAMKQTVRAVSAAMSNATIEDRLRWVDVWMKSAAVVAGEATSSEVVFTDTRSLRAFTVISLEIAWGRLGENPAGKYPGLREAVELAFRDFLSNDIKPVTPELRESYEELARAIAWAGTAKE